MSLLQAWAVNIPYIRAKVTCRINLSVKETWMLRLKIWMLSFLEGSKCQTENDCFFDKEKTYFEAVNNQEEYLRRYEYVCMYANICCMVFLNNMLMTSSHIIFNIPLDLILTNVIICMQKPQVFVLRLFWLLLIQ